MKRLPIAAVTVLRSEPEKPKSHFLAPSPFSFRSQWLADTFKSEKLEDAAEFGRIGRYYAIEDMLTTDPSEKYGQTTLRQHYERIAVEGQEYDPYTSVFGKVANK